MVQHVARSFPEGIQYVLLDLSLQETACTTATEGGLGYILLKQLILECGRRGVLQKSR